MKRNARMFLFGSLLRENVKQLVKKFLDKVENFKANEGWLVQSRANYGVRRIRVYGAKLSAYENEIGSNCDEFMRFHSGKELRSGKIQRKNICNL